MQPGDITEHWLAKRTARAEYCANATIPGPHFRGILDLAMRVKAYDRSGLRKLETWSTAKKFPYQVKICASC